MTTEDIKRLALILAVQAEIEGMKATNKYHLVQGGHPEYTMEHFVAKAEELRDLSYVHDEQLFS